MASSLGLVTKSVTLLISTIPLQNMYRTLRRLYPVTSKQVIYERSWLVEVAKLNPSNRSRRTLTKLHPGSAYTLSQERMQVPALHQPVPKMSPLLLLNSCYAQCVFKVLTHLLHNLSKKNFHLNTYHSLMIINLLSHTIFGEPL